MRLVCPRCHSRYEVPDGAIPPVGREVQCASCTHSWYQLPRLDAGDGPPASPAHADGSPEPHPDNAAAPEPSPGAPPMGQPGNFFAPAPNDNANASAQAGPDGPAAPVPAGVPTTGSTEGSPDTALCGIAMTDLGNVPDSGEPVDDEDMQAPPFPFGADEFQLHPPDRRLDPAILDVLRSEADRELQARRAESAGRPLQMIPHPIPEARPDDRTKDRLAPEPAPQHFPVSGEEPRTDWPVPVPEPRLSEAPAEAAAPPVATLQPAAPPPEKRLAPLKPAAPVDVDPPAASAPPVPPDPTMPQRPARAASRPTPDTAPPPDAGPSRQSVPGLPVAVSAHDLAVVAEARHRRGFRLGFGATAGLVAAMLALFFAAPALIEALPSAAPVLGPVIEGGTAVQASMRRVIEASAAAIGGRLAP